jgi:hypothetical protein
MIGCVVFFCFSQAMIGTADDCHEKARGVRARWRESIDSAASQNISIPKEDLSALYISDASYYSQNVFYSAAASLLSIFMMMLFVSTFASARKKKAQPAAGGYSPEAGE